MKVDTVQMVDIFKYGQAPSHLDTSSCSTSGMSSGTGPLWADVK